MSPAFIKGVGKHLPRARITFDKFHVIAHASTAVDQVRRIDQKTDPTLKGMRWALLKDRDRLSAASRIDLDALIAKAASRRTARAWLCRGRLREILDRKQINVVSRLLKQWCSNVLRSKVEPMKEVARMVRSHFDGIVAWTQTRQTNGFIEALNGLSRPPSARHAATPASRPCAPCSSSLRESSTSPGSTRMPHNPLKFQKSPKTCRTQTSSKRLPLNLERFLGSS